VPETRGGSSTRTVELAVVIIKSASPTPAPDPLVFLQGGPGGGGVEFIVALAGGMGGPMDAVLAKRDVLSIDHRGTGRSRPLLDCPEVNQAAMSPVPPAMMMMSGLPRRWAAAGRAWPAWASTSTSIRPTPPPTTSRTCGGRWASLSGT
jgi:pimeloyl-ACP methyl ester carboxylesterase